jgi:hypothetical protein
METIVDIEKTSSVLQKILGNTDRICVSIILPTHELTPDRATDKLHTERAIASAINQLRNNDSAMDFFREKLKELAGKVDNNHNRKGLGFYVSKNISEMIHFQFNVEEQTLISDHFAVKDLIKQDYFSKTYFVLLLNGKEAKLYRGQMDFLVESGNQHFPILFDDDWEYNKPSRSNSFVSHSVRQSVEDEPSRLRQKRFQGHLRMVDQALSRYIVGQPLIVAGVEKDIALFKEISCLNIVGQIEGSFSHIPFAIFRSMCWNAHHKFLKEQVRHMIDELKELPRNRIVHGYREIYKAVEFGKGARLFIDEHLTLSVTHKAPVNHLEHSIERLLQNTLHKGGEVIVCEHGSISDQDGLVLVSRY